MTAPEHFSELPVLANPPASNGHVPVESTIVAQPTRSRVPRSGLGELWGAAVIFVVVALLLIFALENGQRATRFAGRRRREEPVT